MTKSPPKNVPDMGIELGAACMPSVLASDRATPPSIYSNDIHVLLDGYRSPEMKGIHGTMVLPTHVYVTILLHAPVLKYRSVHHDFYIVS